MALEISERKNARFERSGDEPVWSIRDREVMMVSDQLDVQAM